MEDKFDRYFGNDHPLEDELHPKNQKKKNNEIKKQKYNVWTHIASAAVGGAVSILLYRVVTVEKVVSSSNFLRKDR